MSLNFNVMAAQSGIIKINGKLGGLSFYESNGKSLVREAGGVSKSRIEKDPAYRRTRENMSEFGGSATVGKALRLGLINVSKLFDTRGLVARITKIMRSINSKGAGTRGKRAFEIVPNKLSLIGFDFNESNVFDSLFMAPYSLTANAQKNQVSLIVPVFNTSNYINAPQGATHFRIVCAITALSDYSYNDGAGTYEALNPNINMLNAMVSTGQFALGGDTSNEINIQCNLPNAPTLGDTCALVACIGIEFLQQINSEFYSLKTNNALKIRDVF